MFAEMLSHSEEKIFLEAIDQYFESSKEFESEYNYSLKEDSDENLVKISFDSSDLLNMEKDFNKCKKFLNINNSNNSSAPKKYLMMNDVINIDQKRIDILKKKLYDMYIYQLENQWY